VKTKEVLTTSTLKELQRRIEIPEERNGAVDTLLAAYMNRDPEALETLRTATWEATHKDRKEIIERIRFNADRNRYLKRKLRGSLNGTLTLDPISSVVFSGRDEPILNPVVTSTRIHPVERTMREYEGPELKPLRYLLR